MKKIALNWRQIALAAAVALIALAAFAIRAWTVRGGLPYVDHPDEPNPIDYVVGMLRTGDPNPHAFQKPSLYVYLLLGVLTAHYRLGAASGLYGPLDQMTITTHLYTTIPGFFIWGRMLTVTIATLTVIGAYRVGRYVWGSDAGVIAALFLALSPFHMRHSQYVTTDVASAWLVLLAFGASVAVARAGHWRDYLAAGAFAGLAAATKYNAGTAALMVVAAHLVFWWGRRETGRQETGDRRQETSSGRKSQIPSAFVRVRPRPNSAAGGSQSAGGGRKSRIPSAFVRVRPRPKSADSSAIVYRQPSVVPSALAPVRELPRLLAAGAAALLAFLAGVPYALLSWGEFRSGVLGQVRDYGETTHGDFTGAWNVRGYLGFFRGEGLGPVVCIAALAGLALLLWRRRGAALVWLSFAVPYLLLHMAQSSHFNRNMLPLVVLCALPLSVAGAALVEKVKCKMKSAKVLQFFAFFIFPFAFIGLLLAPSALDTWRYTERLRRGDTRVRALEWLAANVPPGVRVAAELRALPGPLESPWAESPGLLRHDLPWYRSQGYGYLVASSDAWKQWAIPDAYTRFAGRPPAAEFGGADPHDMLGPHLAIYATGLAESDVPVPVAGAARVGGARLLGAAFGLPDPQAPQVGLEPARAFKAGGPLAIRTFWRVEQPFDRDYYIFVHLLDGAGKTVAQRDTPPWQGRFPTTSWRPGAIVVDVNDLALPAGLPPGDYTLVAGMFDPATGAHPLTTLDGRAVDAVTLGELRIEN